MLKVVEKFKNSTFYLQGNVPIDLATASQDQLKVINELQHSKGFDLKNATIYVEEVEEPKTKK